MKKFIVVLLFILITLSLISCENISKATSFDSKAINNGYNNYIAGGNIAYQNNNLYVNFLSHNYKTLGTYKFSKNGVQQIFTENNSIGDYSINHPFFYQTDNNIYVINNGSFMEYDNSKNELTQIKLNYDSFSNTSYFSEDLTVIEDDNGIHVKSKDNYEYTIDDQFYKFYVYKNKIYLINFDGYLYYNDITKKNPDCVFLNDLTKTQCDLFEVCGDYIYFYSNTSDYDEYETGLYRYSIIENKFDIILSGEINCLNSFNDQMYFSTNNGIYKDDIKEISKLTSRSAKEIYLLDEEWIYAIQNDAGNVYRISLDGKKIEMIDFIKS